MHFVREQNYRPASKAVKSPFVGIFRGIGCVNLRATSEPFESPRLAAPTQVGARATTREAPLRCPHFDRHPARKVRRNRPSSPLTGPERHLRRPHSAPSACVHGARVGRRTVRRRRRCGAQSRHQEESHDPQTLTRGGPSKATLSLASLPTAQLSVGAASRIQVRS